MARYVFPFRSNVTYPHTHWNADLAVDVFGREPDPNRTIVACTDGWATVANFPKGGHTVTLRGDDGRHYYHAHLVNNSGVSGRVAMGQKIGVMDNTGNAENRPLHCHWAAGSAAYGIDINGAGDIAPWTLLDQWNHPPYPADNHGNNQAAEIAALETQIAQLNEFIARERSWGSAIVVHVLKPSVQLLDEALTGPAPDPARINQVLELLAAHGGKP